MQQAQTKLIYGLLAGLTVYFSACVLTIPILPLSAVGVPVLMWVTLRWLEVSRSSLRVYRSLR